jgi:tetratricopeptide (TPR) repeat protein
LYLFLIHGKNNPLVANKMKKFMFIQMLFVLFLLIAFETTSYGAGEFEQHYNKAIEFYKQGKYDQAGKEFEKAIKLKPNDVYAIYGLGNTFYCLERHDAAVMVYSKAIEINPNYAKVHYSLSLAYRKLGNTTEAEKHKAIFKKLSKGEKITEALKTPAKPTQTKRYNGTDYSLKRSLGTTPKKSLASVPKRTSLPGQKALDTHSAHEESASPRTPHEQSKHDSGHEEAVHQEKTVYESHKTSATSRDTKHDDSSSIFKGYSEETHKADKRVFNKKHRRKSGTSKNPFGGIMHFVQEKWYVSGINKMWICGFCYIFATQIWLCVVSFLCLIVWRIREND